MNCPFHTQNDQSYFSLLFYTQGTKEYINAVWGPNRRNIPEIKSKK
jgi:hypothetical protein